MVFSNFASAKNHSVQEDQLQFVGNRLREIRKAKGYSNYETLAYELEISRSQYGKYENGGNMKLSTLFKILAHLEVSPVEFFQGIKQF